MIFVFVILAIVIGALMPVQAGLNAELTRQLKNPYIGAFVSLAIGTIAVSTLVFFSGGMSNMKRLNEVSPHLFLGGFLGAIFVGSSLFFIPRMGATAMIAAFITGQLLGSVIIDHYGLMGLTVNPINMGKVIGVILLFVGVLLVIKKPV